MYRQQYSPFCVEQVSAEKFVTLTSDEMEQRDGYGQTKAVAERLLLRAHEQHGLAVRVYRPSVICGDSRTGYSNTQDFENHLLRAIILAGVAVTDTSFSLGWVHVDRRASTPARDSGTQLPEIEISWAQKLLLKTGPSSGPGRRRTSEPAIRKRAKISAFEGMKRRGLPEPGGNRGIGIPQADFAKTAM